MNSIWKAPWGSHIDLSKIVEVLDPETESSHIFTIRFQLMDKTVDVWLPWYLDEKKTKVVETQWHQELIDAWKEFKGEVEFKVDDKVTCKDGYFQGIEFLVNAVDNVRMEASISSPGHAAWVVPFKDLTKVKNQKP